VPPVKQPFPPPPFSHHTFPFEIPTLENIVSLLRPRQLSLRLLPFDITAWILKVIPPCTAFLFHSPDGFSCLSFFKNFSKFSTTPWSQAPHRRTTPVPCLPPVSLPHLLGCLFFCRSNSEDPLLPLIMIRFFFKRLTPSSDTVLFTLLSLSLGLFYLLNTGAFLPVFLKHRFLFNFAQWKVFPLPHPFFFPETSLSPLRSPC